MFVGRLPALFSSMYDVDGAVDGAVEAVDEAVDGEEDGAVDVPGVRVGDTDSCERYGGDEDWESGRCLEVGRGDDAGDDGEGDQYRRRVDVVDVDAMERTELR